LISNIEINEIFMPIERKKLEELTKKISFDLNLFFKNNHIKCHCKKVSKYSFNILYYFDDVEEDCLLATVDFRNDVITANAEILTELEYDIFYEMWLDSKYNKYFNNDEEKYDLSIIPYDVVYNFFIERLNYTFLEKHHFIQEWTNVYKLMIEKIESAFNLKKQQE